MKELFQWVESVRPSATGGEWTPVNHGGSDRQFWRGAGNAAGLIAVHYGPDKAENSRYAHCADFLHRHGVRVPAVLAHDEAWRRILMEDAGSDDLWTHRDEPWSVRRELYAKALREAARLHSLDLRQAEEENVVREPFDEHLYRWEQDYFFTNFLGPENAAQARAAVPLDKQARDLAALPRVLVHRDFQSQNVMVRNGEVTLIDFQGMRAGLAGYDVASLLYDPYVVLTEDERDELSAQYLSMAGRTDAGAWHDELRACARQRLMQALGAYGFLGLVKGKTAFLRHIPVASERLAELCEADPAWQPLALPVRAAARKFAA
jgi:aminoglycoside/choline kinase family phosphotransferase